MDATGFPRDSLRDLRPLQADALRAGEHYPFFSARAQGSRFWDVDGNEFVDYMCAYGPMVLGYIIPWWMKRTSRK